MRRIPKRCLAVAAALAAYSALPAFAGNGLDTNGAHYNLNIVGKGDCSPSPLTGSNRHVIQVLLNFNDGSQNGQTLRLKGKGIAPTSGEPGDLLITLDVRLPTAADPELVAALERLQADVDVRGEVRADLVVA